MSNIASENRCQQISALGRRCRERRSDTHPSLCPRHARHEQDQKDAQGRMDDDPQILARDLLGPVHDFRTAASINHVLGKLLVLVTTNRITSRNAAVTAYICQLLLQSLTEVKSELYDVRQTPKENSPEFNKALKQIMKAGVSPVRRANAEAISPVPQLVPAVNPANSASVPHVPAADPVKDGPALPITLPAHLAKARHCNVSR